MLTRVRRVRAALATAGGARRGLGNDGFSLAETLTAVAIAAIIASVVVSRTITPRVNSEAVAIVQTLFGVTEAMTAYRGTVGRYPSHLEDLVNAPEAGVDTCQRTIPPHFLVEWRGPYLMRTVEDDGIVLGDAVLRDRIVRTPPVPNGSSTGTLTLEISNVEQDVALRVNRMVDEDDDLAGGTVRWTAQGTNGTGTLAYDIPIRGC